MTFKQIACYTDLDKSFLKQQTLVPRLECDFEITDLYLHLQSEVPRKF